MKATEVRILPALEPGESYVDPVFVLVETSLNECGDTVTTIDHVSSKQVDGRDRWHVTTLGQSVPLTHASALEWAVSYAELRHPARVRARRDRGRRLRRVAERAVPGARHVSGL